MDEKELGNLLVASGYLTDKQLESGRNYQKSLGGSLPSVIVKLGFVTEKKLLKFIGNHEGMPVVDLEDMIIPIKLIETVPAKVIEKYNILPIHLTGDVLAIATADPTSFEAAQEIQFLTGKKVELHLAARKSLKIAINKFLNLGQGVIDDPLLQELSSDGKLRAYRDKSKISKHKLYEIWQPALIPLLIEKGIITEDELEKKSKEIKKEKQ